jgi:endonuclease/exonuclease/phosphatase family metal-dependent hydrolase
MKIHHIIIFVFLIGLLVSCSKKADNRSDLQEPESVELRIAAYNVEVSRNATAQEIGEALQQYELDVIGFSEAPGGSWTNEVAEILGMDHVVSGRYTTAGHDDKYKTIASKTPLYGLEEVLMADTLHTATKAITDIDGVEIAIYSVHFPFGWRDQAHIDETTGKISSLIDHLDQHQNSEISVVVGDFNFIPSSENEESMYHEMFKEIGLDFAWDNLGIDATTKNTHNAFEPSDEGNGNVIDHIMYNPKKAVAIEGGVIEMGQPLSDHKPVWALIQIEQE